MQLRFERSREQALAVFPLIEDTTERYRWLDRWQQALANSVQVVAD